MEPGALAGLVGLADFDLVGLLSRLRRAGVTAAAAESLTGGLFLALLTEVPGSSAVVRGGLVTYATDLKHSLAGVDAHLLAARGPVDPDVALALATGAATSCRADVGFGLTGVAGPETQDGVAVGTFFVAAAARNVSKVIAHRPGDEVRSADAENRHLLRSAAVRAAVQLLDEFSRSDVRGWTQR